MLTTTLTNWNEIYPGRTEHEQREGEKKEEEEEAWLYKDFFFS